MECPYNIFIIHVLVIDLATRDSDGLSIKSIDESLREVIPSKMIFLRSEVCLTPMSMHVIHLHDFGLNFI